MAPSPMFLGGVAVAGLGLLLDIIGLGTTEWIVVDGVDSSRGLFRACAGSTCVDIDNPTSDEEAVRAMCLIGCLAGILGVGLAVLFLILQFCGKTIPKIVVMLSTISCVVAFIATIIGVIIYGAEVYDPVSKLVDLGYSFALTIVGAVLIGLGGAVIFFAGKSSG